MFLARLPWVMACKVLLLGAGTGCVLSGLRWVLDVFVPNVEKEEIGHGSELEIDK